MLNSQICTEIFNRLFTIADNKACFDCYSPKVEFASLNHGIFLCSSCASLHKKFLSQISLIKSIYQENWSENELNLMIMGGNIKFRNFLDIYKFPRDFSIEMRYNTVAVAYYREMLNNQLEKKLIPEPPSLEEGKKLCENMKQVNYEEINRKNRDPEVEIIDKTFDVFNKMASYTKEKVKKVGDTLKDPNFQEDVKFYSNKVAESGKEFGLKAYSFLKKKFNEKNDNEEKKDNNEEKVQDLKEKNNDYSEFKQSFEKKEENYKESAKKVDEIGLKQEIKQEFPVIEEEKALLAEKESYKKGESEIFGKESQNFEKNVPFDNYNNNFSRKTEENVPFVFPNPDDKLDKALDYLDRSYDKVIKYDYSNKFKALGNGIMTFSKKTYSKAQEKWQDKQFQEDLQHKKENFMIKTKEFGEKTGNIAKCAYESLKKKL